MTPFDYPKLDERDCRDKLTEIIRNNNIKSVTVVRMGVPCCGEFENAVKWALQNSGRMISLSLFYAFLNLRNLFYLIST